MKYCSKFANLKHKKRYVHHHSYQPSIHKLVLREFLMELRKRKLYHCFLCGVSSSMLWRKLDMCCQYHTYGMTFEDHSDKIAFASCHNYDDVIAQMTNAMERNYHKSFRHIEAERSKQRYICDEVNYLLHCFVEKYAIKARIKVDEIGKAIFTNVCKKVFGENFVDLTEENREMPLKLGANNFMEMINGLIDNSHQFQLSSDIEKALENAHNTFQVTPVQTSGASYNVLGRGEIYDYISAAMNTPWISNNNPF